jgi:hypothetical protein
MEVIVFGVVAPRNLVVGNQRFGGRAASVFTEFNHEYGSSKASTTLVSNHQIARRNNTQKYDLRILTYFLTHSLTPWCRILFEKLIVTQLIKKYPTFFM